MTLSRIIVMSVLALAIVLPACRREPAAVPRRTAYARVAVLDSAAEPVPDFPLYFPLSRSARVSSPRPLWLDVAYPDYGATAHITLTLADGEALDRVKANRLERLMLNAGDRPGRRSEWLTPAGYDVLTLYTDGSATPWQFVATDDSSAVLSGAVYFADPAAVANADSLAPMVDAIAADITAALNAMRPL